MKYFSKIPVGNYCYSPKGRCPYYWINPFGDGDCSLANPKWKFWKWNGWKYYDRTIDNQTKICDVNKYEVKDSRSELFAHPVVGWEIEGEQRHPLINGHEGLIRPEDHVVYKKGYKIVEL